MIKALIFTFLFVSVFPSSALSGTEQTLSLEDLMNISVTTVSKKKESILKAPGVVSVISKEEIEAYDARNLIDLLGRIPGVFAGSSFDFYDDIVSIRAQHSSSVDKHILILINGRQVVETLFNGLNNLIYKAFPLSSIERIEVIRGPGSVLYGTNAIEGVVNIITKVAEDEGVSIYASQSGGSFSTYKSEITAVGSKGDFKYTISALDTTTEGWTADHKDTQDNESTFNKKESDNTVFFNWKYKKIRFDFMHSSGAHQLLNHDAGKPYIHNYLDKKFYNLGYDTQVNKNHKVSFDITHNKNFLDRDASKLENFSKNTMFELNLNGKISENSNYLIGITSNHVSGENTYTDSEWDFSKTWRAQFLQLDFNITKNLNIVLGARSNKVDGHAADTSPRLGLIYNSDSAFGVKLLYGESYRSPSGFETDVVGHVSGNPNLKPEKMSTYTLNPFLKYKNTFISMAVFQSKLKETISFSPSDLSYDNSGESLYTGGELEVKHQLSRTVEINSSISYQENSLVDGENNFKKSPNTMIKMGSSIKGSTWSFAGHANYFSKIEGHEVHNSSTKTNNPTQEAYTNLSINIRYKLKNDYPEYSKSEPTLSFFLDNALNNSAVFQPDENTSKVNTLPHQPGRNFVLKLSMKI